MPEGTISTGTLNGAVGREAKPGSTGPEPESSALATMAAMLTVLDSVVRSVPAPLLERRPTSDEWSPREVLGHLLYVERLLRDRVAAMVADARDAPMPKGDPAPPPAAPSVSLAEWRHERGQTLAWLSALGPLELERASVSPRFGRITAREQIDEWAYHDLDHLRPWAFRHSVRWVTERPLVTVGEATGPRRWPGTTGQRTEDADRSDGARCNGKASSLDPPVTTDIHGGVRDCVVVSPAGSSARPVAERTVPRGGI